MAAYIGYLLLAGIQIPLFSEKNILGKRCFNKKSYLILCCVELIILTGLRGYTVGADTAVYLKALDYYSNLPWSNILTAKLVWPFDFESGYFALTKVCAFLGIGKTAFLFLIAIIIYVPVFIVIYRYSSMPYVSILCYFAFGMFAYSLGIFRQMIAISILLCGWKYVVERRLWKYIIVVGVATLFHATALVAIALYILYVIKWKRIIWVLPLAEVAFVILGRPIVEIIVKLFPQYAHHLYDMYGQPGGSYLMLILLNFVLIMSIIFGNKRNSNEQITICALIIAILLQAIGYSMALFGRIVPYFSTYLIFAIPSVIYGMGKKWRIPASAMVIILLFCLIIREFSGNEYITPYYMFFQ